MPGFRHDFGRGILSYALHGRVSAGKIVFIVSHFTEVKIGGSDLFIGREIASGHLVGVFADGYGVVGEISRLQGIQLCIEPGGIRRSGFFPFSGKLKGLRIVFLHIQSQQGCFFSGFRIEAARAFSNDRRVVLQRFTVLFDARGGIGFGAVVVSRQGILTAGVLGQVIGKTFDGLLVTALLKLYFGRLVGYAVFG